MVQSIAGSVAGLVTACREEVYVEVVGPDEQAVLVSHGRPGQYLPAAVVAVGWATRMPITRPTMGTQRSREQVAEIDVVISVFVPGDESSQVLADTAALDLQLQLEAYLRTAPNEKLAGACYDAWVSDATLVPAIAYQSTDDPDQDPIPTGRVAELTVTVTVKIRY